MHNEHQPSSKPDTEKRNAVNESRRRFAKGGAAAGVVLSTLASRSVLAEACATPSIAGSGNESTPGIKSCSAPTPDSWANKLTQGKYTGTSIQPADKFFIKNNSGYFTSSTNFSGTTLGIDNENNFTIAEALGRYSSNTNDLAAWAASALIAAAQGASGAFGGTLNATGPDPSVFGIMDEYARNSFFVPTAGKKWYAQDILWYFQGHDFN